MQVDLRGEANSVQPPGCCGDEENDEEEEAAVKPHDL